MSPTQPWVTGPLRLPTKGDRDWAQSSPGTVPQAACGVRAYKSSRSTVDVLLLILQAAPQPSVQIIPRVPLRASRPGKGSNIDGGPSVAPR
ncbi:hypothetical protein [Rhodococcus erythropolis]|uniref:hypothetical protein n=1 Tax=Rhodococcus erythropolis TaxID=1833 RepID=UPI00210C8BA7|nr:hypothetical protein [Rhodococcus erythropolis]